MEADRHCSPFQNRAFRHIPDGSRYGPLDTTLSGLATDNRWNHVGEETLYLASDPAVLMAEWSRHFDSMAEIGRRSRQRRMYAMDVALDLALDLRDAAVQSSLGLTNYPLCFVDKESCRALGRELRTATRAQALVVPSLALLDSPDFWCLVVFIDKLPSFPEPYIAGLEEDGTFGWSPPTTV